MANKIINKQGKSVMLDFFANCSDLCQLTVATIGAPCIFHSRYWVNFAGLWVRLKIEKQYWIYWKINPKILDSFLLDFGLL